MSEKWRTRSDRSGIRPQPTPAVRHAFEYLQLSTGSPSLHVQKMATKGVAVTIRVADHPIFGSLISFGLSGLLSDLLADRAFSTLPISPTEAAALLDRPRAAPILDGYAGDTPADRTALIELMGRVSCLAEDVPEMRRLAWTPGSPPRQAVGALCERDTRPAAAVHQRRGTTPPALTPEAEPSRRSTGPGRADPGLDRRPRPRIPGGDVSVSAGTASDRVGAQLVGSAALTSLAMTSRSI